LITCLYFVAVIKYMCAAFECYVYSVQTFL